MDEVKYWLYIEPYVYIVIKGESALFYNTFTGHRLEYNNKSNLLRILKRINKKENLRVIGLNSKELEDKDIKKFITDVKKYFIGDTIDFSISNSKPIQFTPILNNMRDKKNLQKREDTSKYETKDYLTEIFLFLNGNCLMDCNFCAFAFKQFFFCTKNNDKELDISVIDNLLNQAIGSNINFLNFTGGNILQYSHLNHLPKILEKYMIKGDFYIYLINFINDYNRFPKIPDDLYEIKVILPPRPPKQQMEQLFHIIRSTSINVSLILVVENELDFDVNKEVKELKIEYSFSPLYNHSNLDFFKDNVFLNRDDIFEKIFSYKDIFRNMSLNSEYFGKIILKNNGEIFSSLYSPSIGNLYENTLNEILYNEMFGNSNWFNTRKRKPCKNCLYQYFCPPPSNYEKVIGKYNLCNVIE